MKNITFLFGAGASCKALPTVNEIGIRIQSQIEKIKIEITKPITEFSIGTQQTEPSANAKEYINDLEWLHDMSAEHASVDTFAKKLFLSNASRMEMYKLKNTLSVFFLIEQLTNKIDNRYDSFFAALLKEEYEMPENVKVISWNYDMQFEMAFQKFSGEESLYAAQRRLKVYHKFANNIKLATNRFGIYKVNGSSLLYSNDNARMETAFTNLSAAKFNFEILEQILESYIKIKNNYASYIHGLSFAWEDEYNDTGNDIISLTQRGSMNTEVLVVIGYSFPFFNREIDRKLIQNMVKLDKIYIQAPDAEELVEKFYSIRNDFERRKLIPIKNCSQFFLPHEL